MLINLVHIGIGSFLLLVAWIGNTLMQMLLKWLVTAAVAYHVYRWFSNGGRMVNLKHLTLIFPLLLYATWVEPRMSVLSRWMIAGVGLSAIGVHGSVLAGAI